MAVFCKQDGELDIIEALQGRIREQGEWKKKNNRAGRIKKV